MTTFAHLDDKKKKKGRVNTELLGFHFEKKIESGHFNRPLRKKNFKSESLPLTMSQYMHANFHFYLFPNVSPFEKAFYSQDTNIEWEHVICLGVQNESNSSEFVHSLFVEGISKCPICLDILNLPKITRCGHLFCFPCILKHMRLSSENASTRCPICMKHIYRDDLKSVIFQKSVSLNHLSSKKKYIFQLVKFSSGSSSPLLIQSSNQFLGETKDSFCIRIENTDSLVSLDQVIPRELSLESQFSKFSYKTVEDVIEHFDKQLVQLQELRQLCLNPDKYQDVYIDGFDLDRMGDVELLPYIDEARQLIESERSKFESQILSKPLSQSLMSRGIKGNFVQDLLNLPRNFIVKIPSGLILESKTDRNFSSNTKFETTLGQKEYLNCQNNSDIHSILLDFSHSADIEATLDTEDAIQDRLSNSNSGLVVEPPSNFPLLSAQSHVFQLFEGQPIYLLPFCTKCILEAFADKQQIPARLEFKIIDFEQVRVDNHSRKKFPFLDHLPIYSEVVLVEVNLRQYTPERILKKYLGKIKEREKSRSLLKKKTQKSERQEHNKKLFEDFLKQETLQSMKDLQLSQEREIEDLLNGPKLPASIHHQEQSTLELEGDSNEEHNKSNVVQASYANIATKGGNFPALGETFQKQNNYANYQSGGVIEKDSRRVQSPSWPVMGTMASETMVKKDLSVGSPITNEIKKKNKKKQISLLSNMSMRSYK